MLRQLTPALRRGNVAAEVAGTQGFLHDDTMVVNVLKAEQVVRGVPVARINEDGHGVVHLHVRKDKETFEFSFRRTLPGEKLNLKVGLAKHDRFKKKEPGKYRLAIHERTAASTEEVKPRCPHFAQKCGGCAFQNLRYKSQLSEKMHLLEILLDQFGLLRSEVDLADPVSSPSTFGFHARTEFRAFLRDGLQFGMHPEGSPIPIPITECHLHSDSAQLAFDALRRSLRAAGAAAFDERTGRGWLCNLILRSALPRQGAEPQLLATLVTLPEAPRDVLESAAREAQSQCSALVGVTWSQEGGEGLKMPGWRSRGHQKHEVLAGRPYLLQDVDGVPIRLVPEGFLRPNIFLASELSRTVVDFSKASSDSIVWDAFCGQGLLTLPLAAAGSRLVALDRSQPALEALRSNLKAQSLTAEVVCGDLGIPVFLQRLLAALPTRSTISRDTEEEGDFSEDETEEADQASQDDSPPFVGAVPTTLPAPNVLVVDPGRNGLPKPFRRFALDLRVPTLIYVGSGRGLLRDVALLSKRGYQLRKLQPIDLQPHSARLEIVARLVWSGERRESVDWLRGGKSSELTLASENLLLQ
eukprot:s285_g5.t1